MTFEHYNLGPLETSRETKILLINRLLEEDVVANIILENGYDFSGRITLFLDNSIWIQRWDPINHSLSQETIIVGLDNVREITIP